MHIESDCLPRLCLPWPKSRQRLWPRVHASGHTRRDAPVLAYGLLNRSSALVRVAARVF